MSIIQTKVEWSSTKNTIGEKTKSLSTNISLNLGNTQPRPKVASFMQSKKTV